MKVTMNISGFKQCKFVTIKYKKNKNHAMCSNNTRTSHALGAATGSGVAVSGSRAMLSERKRAIEKRNYMEISYPFASPAMLQTALW